MSSSLSFQGDSTSYLTIPSTYKDSYNFGTGDFTIEWYQYQTDSKNNPRIFQIGNYSTATIGVSIEGGIFYFWRNGPYTRIITLSYSQYKNKWVHFAISRTSGITKIFMDGTSIYSMSDTQNYVGATTLVIGNESTPASESSFGGYMAYFTWVKGVGLYTSNFTVSNYYPSLTSNYILLLTAESFDGILGSHVVNTNVGIVQNIPANFLGNSSPPSPLPTPSPVIPAIKYTKSLFSNNSMVFYSRGSLSSCGVGSVRNSSVKSRKI